MLLDFLTLEENLHLPGGFDAMAWVDGAAHTGIHKLTVHSYGLQETLEFWVDKVLLQLGNRLINLLGELRVVDNLADAGTYVDENHDDAMALQLDRFLKLWSQDARSSEETLCILEDLESTLCIFLLAGSQSIL